MTETLFYHLEGRTLEDILPGLVEKSRQRGWKALIRADTADRADAIDGLLWTYDDQSFLPHAQAGDGEAARQPVLVTVEEGNPNGAEVLFCVGGAQPDWSDEKLSQLARIVLLFDGRDFCCPGGCPPELEGRQGRGARRHLLEGIPFRKIRKTELRRALGFFNPIMIGMFLISLAMAWHIIRSGRSPLWLLALAIASFMPGVGFFATVAIWLGYLFTAVIPDFFNSHGARKFKASMREVADPGRAYREAKRDADRVGSVDAKRALAEESLKRGLYADAVGLYENAMSGPLGGGDPTLLKGMARAQLLAGNAGASEEWFLKLKELDPKAFDTDSELDYARALEEQGKTEAAVAQYEKVAPRYSGEEARVRFGLLLQKLGQEARAQALFREAIESVQDAPSYYRSRQTEWVKLAKQNLK